jgi:hypothetical protein
LDLLLEDLPQLLDRSTFSALLVQLQLLVVLQVADRDQVVVVQSERQPRPHVRVVLLVLVVAEAVLGIEVGDDALEEEEPALGIGEAVLDLLVVGPLLLNRMPATSASVGLMTKMWRLQESLLTANQFPSLLKAIE